MSKLIVNAFYGHSRQLQTKDVAMTLDLNPFQGTHRGILPTFLAESIGPLVKTGVDIRRGNRDHHIRGVQISRSVAYAGLLNTLQTLATMSKELEEPIEVNISRCGNLGTFSLRYLLGLSNCSISFIDFPDSWNISELVPLSERYSYILEDGENANTAEKLVTFDTDKVKKAGKKKKRGNDSSAPTVNFADDVDDAALAAEQAEEHAQLEEPEEVEVEQEQEEEQIPVPVKPKATRKKKKVVEEPEPEEAEELEEAPKPVKKRATRKAKPASKEKLAELEEHFSK